MKNPTKYDEKKIIKYFDQTNICSQVKIILKIIDLLTTGFQHISIFILY